MKDRIFTRFGSLIFTCLLVALCCSAAFAQYKGSAVKKDKLISVLLSRQLQTREIVDVIRSNGVDFLVTAAVEKELVAAGARPEVIEAARLNYRATVATTPIKGPVTPSKFTGQPLTKETVIVLLQNGVADAQIRGNVSTRGVNFKPTVADKAEIKRAGGSDALVNLIVASYAIPNQGSGTNSDMGGGADRYNALIDRAVTQYDVSKDTAGAIATLQQAAAVEPGRSRAYQQIGFMYLYGQKNFTEAEKYMRMAIERGGSAVFRVFHDHGALMTDTCAGSLFIAKDTVRYESDNNKHTFETTDADIKEVKMGSKFAAVFSAKSGAFKIALKSGETNSKNYNFAPLTNDSQESKMIIRLIGK